MRQEEQLLIEGLLVPNALLGQPSFQPPHKIHRTLVRPHIKHPRVERQVFGALRVPRPPHAGIVQPVNKSVRRLLIEPIRHSLQVVVSVQMLEWVLQDDDIHVG